MGIHTVLVKIPFCALLELILHMVRIVAKHFSEIRMDLFLELQKVGLKGSDQKLKISFQIDHLADWHHDSAIGCELEYQKYPRSKRNYFGTCTVDKFI